MSALDVLPQLHELVAELVLALVDEPPEDEDVTAGWLAFGVFLALLGAVALLGFSLVKQLRKAQAAKDAGVYGDDPAAPEGDEPQAFEPRTDEPRTDEPPA